MEQDEWMDKEERQTHLQGQVKNEIQKNEVTGEEKSEIIGLICCNLRVADI